jgi:hypothetical protein
MDVGGRTRRLSLALLVLACALFTFSSIAGAKTHRAHRPRPRCFIPPNPAVPTAEGAALDPSVTGAFAILRRPAGPADALPPLNPLKEDLGYQLRSYFPAYIRQLVTDAEGEHYFLVMGFPRVIALPPAACLPRDVRRHLSKLVAKQRMREKQLMFCIDDVGPKRPEYGGGRCHPLAAVQSGENLIESATSHSDVTDLVPDGVATVRLLYHDGNVLTAPVNGNEFTFTPPQRPIKQAAHRLRRIIRTFSGSHLSERQRERALRRFIRLLEQMTKQLSPETVQWLSAGGQPIRSFHPRAEGSGPLIGEGGGFFTGEGASSLLGSLEISPG